MSRKNKVRQGNDGLYALCFMDHTSRSEKEICEEFSKYGEVVRFTRLPGGLVFLRFACETAAQNCLDDNQNMNVAEDKKSARDKDNGTRCNGKIQNWRSPNSAMTGSTESVREIKEPGQSLPDSESPGKNMNSSQNGASGIKSNGSWISKRIIKDSPKTIGDISEPQLQPSPNSVKTSRHEQNDLDSRGEIPSSILDSRDEIPPLLLRNPKHIPGKRAVDMIFANFPENFTSEDVEHVVEDFCPLKVGRIMKTKFNEPYCHVYLTKEAAIAAETYNNKIIIGDYNLIIARAKKLINEAVACRAQSTA